MTQPPEVLYASEQYQEWLSALKKEAMLATHNQSQAMIRAVMHELRRYLTTTQVMEFADALPPLPRGIFIENWRPSGNPQVLSSASDFRLGVINTLSPHHIPPESIVGDVFKVLAEHSNWHDAEKMRSVLPDALKPFWPKKT